MTGSAGYSGTPLVRKLGLTTGMKVRLLLDAKQDIDGYWSRLGARAQPHNGPGAAAKGETKGGSAQTSAFEPAAFELLAEGETTPADFTHLFATSLNALRSRLALGRDGMATNGMVWVSWPKKSSSLASEISRSEVMAEGHAAGLVDVKVCAVDEDWSGLKFVVPVADRD